MKPKLSATATAGWNIGDDFRRYARSDGFALGVVGVSQEIAGLRDKAVVLHFWSSMKTATVRELRNRSTQLLEWIDAGEEIRITRRGIVIARLVPRTAPELTLESIGPGAPPLHWIGSTCVP
jgi:hypothetical protein